MLSAQDTQFRLNDHGRISYQAQASNPLPGVEVACVKKGEGLLAPAVELLEGVDLGGADAAAVQAHLQGWVQRHIATVLEPLVNLTKDEDTFQPTTKEGEEAQPAIVIKPAVKELAAKVHAALGIVPREQVQDLIDQLDADDRRVLRAKRIRLGPILVFQPDLNKPAAVRLRALLWSLDRGKDLPAAVPNDGIVSQRIEGEIDPDFYRAISYPVYGGRAIRIDMLDRVINAIYEAAQGGKFQAQHQMAEWLGCPILDLYDVLSAMGHTKIHDPADEVKEEEEKPAEEASEEKATEKKPALATFRLKKGKANEQRAPKPVKQDKPKQDKPKGKRNKSTNKQPRVMSAEAKNIDPDDNPFAILKQLKTK